MDRRILYRIMLGACFALAAGGLAAQTPSTNAKEEKSATQQQSATEAQKSAMPGKPAASPKMPSASAEKPSADKSATSGEKPAKHATAKQMHKTRAHTQAKKTKTPRTAKAKEQSAPPDEVAYRQALRECVMERDTSQRDRCLDDTIERFHRNA